MLVTYVIVNWSLILEILVGDSSYVSHREEMVSSATPFFETFWSLFRNSAQHAPSLHKYLILPIVIFLLLGAFFIPDRHRIVLCILSYDGGR